MSEWTKKQKRSFLIIAFVHLELGLLLGVDIFLLSFQGILTAFQPWWIIVSLVAYGVTGLLFLLGIILDYTIWHKGLEVVFKKKEKVN